MEVESCVETLCFRVPPGKKFTKGGLHPIVKDCTSDGRPTYIAEILDYVDEYRTGLYKLDIMEGMTLTDMLVHHQLNFADVSKLELHVVVLRYSPETYPLHP